MIDTVSLLLFSLLIVYTAFRALILDKKSPWLVEEDEKKNSGRGVKNYHKCDLNPCAVLWAAGRTVAVGAARGPWPRPPVELRLPAPQGLSWAEHHTQSCKVFF